MIAGLIGLMAVSVMIVMLNALHWRGEEVRPLYDKTGKIDSVSLVEGRNIFKRLSDGLFKKESKEG